MPPVSGSANYDFVGSAVMAGAFVLVSCGLVLVFMPCTWVLVEVLTSGFAMDAALPVTGAVVFGAVVFGAVAVIPEGSAGLAGAVVC